MKETAQRVCFFLNIGISRTQSLPMLQWHKETGSWWISPAKRLFSMWQCTAGGEPLLRVPHKELHTRSHLPCTRPTSLGPRKTVNNAASFCGPGTLSDNSLCKDLSYGEHSCTSHLLCPPQQFEHSRLSWWEGVQWGLDLWVFDIHSSADFNWSCRDTRESPQFLRLRTYKMKPLLEMRAV